MSPSAMQFCAWGGRLCPPTRPSGGATAAVAVVAATVHRTACRFCPTGSANRIIPPRHRHCPPHHPCRPCHCRGPPPSMAGRRCPCSRSDPSVTCASAPTLLATNIFCGALAVVAKMPQNAAKCRKTLQISRIGDKVFAGPLVKLNVTSIINETINCHR